MSLRIMESKESYERMGQKTPTRRAGLSSKCFDDISDVETGENEGFLVNSQKFHTFGLYLCA